MSRLIGEGSAALNMATPGREDLHVITTPVRHGPARQPPQPDERNAPHRYRRFRRLPTLAVHDQRGTATASMKPGFYTIMAAQFFSSLADNALLIAAMALLAE